MLLELAVSSGNGVYVEHTLMCASTSPTLVLLLSQYQATPIATWHLLVCSGKVAHLTAGELACCMHSLVASELAATLFLQCLKNGNGIRRTLNMEKQNKTSTLDTYTQIDA